MVWQPVYKDTPYGPVFTGQWRGFNQTASTIKTATRGTVDVGTALFSLGSAIYSVKVAPPALAAGTLSTGGTVFLGATGGPSGSRIPEPERSSYQNPNGRGVPGVPPGLYDNGRGPPVGGATPVPPVTRP